MARPPRRSIGRRGFLKDAAAGAAALVAAPALAGEPKRRRRRSCVPPRRRRRRAWSPPKPLRRRRASTSTPPTGPAPTSWSTSSSRSTSSTSPPIPVRTFRGLHESFINYGGNKSPELLTCCHEESSVAMAHGYAKIEGKPMMVMAHGTVGLQHASMAIYNAYADRVPVYIVLGNIADVGVAAQ